MNAIHFSVEGKFCDVKNSMLKNQEATRMTWKSTGDVADFSDTLFDKIINLEVSGHYQIYTFIRSLPRNIKVFEYNDGVSPPAVLPEGLTTLFCPDSKGPLPKLPDTLMTLECSPAQFAMIKKLPKSLINYPGVSNRIPAYNKGKAPQNSVGQNPFGSKTGESSQLKENYWKAQYLQLHDEFKEFLLKK